MPTGHVLGSQLQTLVGVTIVTGVAVGLGCRPTGSLLRWLAVGGILALSAFALAWLAVALGLAAKSVETASNTPMILTLLPFLGSGFVPTLRRLLNGAPAGGPALTATEPN